MKKHFPQAILLDFYGTVVEEDDVYIAKICQQITANAAQRPSATEVSKYWSRVFSQLCTESYGDSFQLQKDLERVSLMQVLHHFQANLDVDTLSQPLLDYWAAPMLFPESKNVLAQCPVPICLVSNIDNAELASALQHHQLSFDYIVTSEDCRAYKPRRAMFDQALCLLGLQAMDVVHVGDSLNSDVRGAINLEMPVLWLNRKRRVAPHELKPTYTAANLQGLIELYGGKIDKKLSMLT